MADEGNAAAKAAMDERNSRKKDAEEKERIILEEREQSKSRERSKYSDEGNSSGRYDSRDSHRAYQRDFGGRDYDDRGNRDGRHHNDRQYDDEHQERSRDRGQERHSDDDGEKRHRNRHRSKEEKRKEKKSTKGGKKYGSLFKSSKADRDNGRSKSDDPAEGGNAESKVLEGSAEYWNDQRAKLGLKPLKE